MHDNEVTILVFCGTEGRVSVVVAVVLENVMLLEGNKQMLSELLEQKEKSLP